MTTGSIRLACICCDRQDFDGITAEELQQAVRNGWLDIQRVQSDDESHQTYADSAQAPAGHSIFAWWTHLGCCPACARSIG